MLIGFAGLSHLGLVTSVATASRGFDVVAYDPDAALCQALGDGRLPVFEPGLPELLAAARPRIRFTPDAGALAGCPLVVFSSDVPTGANNRSDLRPLRRLIEGVVAQAAGAVLVVLSQVPPGFTRKLAEDLRRADGGRELPLYYQVETLVFGRAVERALHPERFIVGCGDDRTDLPAPYTAWLNAFGCPVLPMRYESAELAKISINMCLVSSVTVANTLAELCEVVGADWSEIVPALRLDRRVGPHAYLQPGLGIAGGNLERDLVTVSDLAAELGTDAGVVDAWLANSRHRADWALRTIHTQVIGKADRPVIALWGLAYKADTRSTKNSPALALARALRPFPVQAYDPQVVLDGDEPSNVVQAWSAYHACEGADALAVMTPWPEFASADPARLRGLMAGRVIVDPFACLDRRRCAESGFLHLRLGSPPGNPLTR